MDEAWESGLPGNLACGRRPAFGLNAVSSPGGVPTSKIVDDSLWHHPPFQDSACAPRSSAMPATILAVSQGGSQRLERLRQSSASLTFKRRQLICWGQLLSLVPVPHWEGPESMMQARNVLRPCDAAPADGCASHQQSFKKALLVAVLMAAGVPTISQVGSVDAGAVVTA